MESFICGALTNSAPLPENACPGTLAFDFINTASVFALVFIFSYKRLSPTRRPKNRYLFAVTGGFLAGLISTTVFIISSMIIESSSMNDVFRVGMSVTSFSTRGLHLLLYATGFFILEALFFNTLFHLYTKKRVLSQKANRLIFNLTLFLLILFVIPVGVELKADVQYHKESKIVENGNETEKITLMQNSRFSEIKKELIRKLVPEPRLVENPSEGLVKETIHVNPAVTGVLLLLLLDKNIDVQEQAIIALGNIGDKKTTPGLISFLDDKSDRLKEWAIESLGRIKDERAVEPLARILRDDKDNDIKSSVLKALGSIKGEHARAILLGYLEVKDEGLKKSAVSSLLKIKEPRAIEPAFAFLYDHNVAIPLEQMGKYAVIPLMKILQKNGNKNRKDFARLLGDIKDRRAVNVLISALHDPEVGVREAAAGSLGQIKDARSVEPLVAALNDSDIHVRLSAFYALAVFKNPRVKQIISSALKSFKDKRYTASETSRLVLALYRNSNIDASYAEPLVSLLSQGWPWLTYRPMVEIMEKIGRPAVKSLCAALQEEDYRNRFSAAVLLGKIGDYSAVEPLVPVTHDPDRRVRECAVWALGEIKDKRAVEPLIDALHDSYSVVRWNAAAALAKINDVRAVEFLILALDDVNWVVRKCSAEALQKITGRDFGEDAAKWRDWRHSVQCRPESRG
jgi:HEAT repeat protein